MASPVEAHLILCDHAVTDPSGKVHMLGAGWTVTGTPTAPHGVAVLMKVPWDRANQKIPLHLRLLDDNGQPVHPQGPHGPGQAEVKADLEVGRPPGLKPGSPLPAAFAINVAPMLLPPGRYEWRLTVAQTDYAEGFQVIESSVVSSSG